MTSPTTPSSPDPSTRTFAGLPNQLELVSLGPTGSGTHLMLSALAAALVQAGLSEPPPITVAADLDGGAAIRRVAAGGPGVLGSCTPAYLTTPIVHGLHETWRTLTPVAQLVADSYLLVVPAGSVASPMALFSRPVTVVVPKRGGNTDIQAMLLGEATGMDVSVIVEHDPARLLDTLVDGRAQWTTGVYSDFAGQLAAGRLEILATFDAKPTAELAVGFGDSPTAAGTDTRVRAAPTLRESGIDVSFPLWRGVIGPGGLPDSVVSSWAEALQAALAQQAWLDYIRTNHLRSAYLPAAEFSDLLADEDKRYRHWVSALDERLLH